MMLEELQEQQEQEQNLSILLASPLLTVNNTKSCCSFLLKLSNGDQNLAKINWY